MTALHAPHDPLLPMRARVLLPAAWLASFAARAQGSDYPTKPVRWICPTSAGAGTDAAARSFAKIAGDAWKQSVVVDNRSGASGMIGLDAVAQAAPDGYTLGFYSVSQFLDATLLNRFAFDAQKDFTPISLLASTPLLLVTHAGARLDTLPQLLAAAKSQPKVLNYASGGAGGITHFAMEVFLKRAGIEVTHIAYKGSGPAVLDTLSGQVQMGFATPGAVMQHVKAGKLRAIGIAAPKRSPLAPEVPTFGELGLSDLSLSVWYGLFGPARMAPDLVDRISRSITTAAQSTPVREKMVADGLDPILNTPAEFTRFLRADRDQWLGVAKAINFRPQS